MATKVFRGDSLDVAHLETITIGGTWIAGETVTITINGKDAVHTVVSGSTSISDVVAGLITAITNITPQAGEFSELTWVDADPDITATGNTPGVTHTITTSTDSVSGTINDVETTAATGREHLIAGNVDGGLPAASDVLIFEQSSTNLKYGLTALNGVTYDELRIMASYTGEIGNPMRNPQSPDYFEYRDRRLDSGGATLIVIGAGEGSGSGRIDLNCSDTNVTIRVLKTARSVDDNHAVRITNTGATSNIEISGTSTVDLGIEEDDDCQFSNIDVSGNAQVRIGQNTVFTNLRISGSASVDLSSLDANTDITLIEIKDNATLTIRGDNAITTINQEGTSTVTDFGTGTITAYNRSGQANYTNVGTAAVSGERIMTDATLQKGAGIWNSHGVTVTNGYTLPDATLQEHPNFNPGYDLTVSI